jgi:hypothetical protein
MGQAKDRGTFEQRQAEAVERRALKAAAAQAIQERRQRMINATPPSHRPTIAATIAAVILASQTTRRERKTP